MVNLVQDSNQEQSANVSAPADSAAQTATFKAPDIPIQGRFDKYRSPYWSGVVAALGARYLPRPFVRNHFDDKHMLENGQANPDYSHMKKHGYSAFAGAMLTGVASLYAVRTYQDIKSIFSEVVGWEMHKDPKDVTMSDMFHSKNSVVKQTMDNYVRFNARRFGINAVYFLPFIAHKTFKKMNLHGETGVDLGVAVNAGYLFSDIISRKMTPFEELQTLIDNKINHASHYADTFVATDLMDIYERHAEHDKNNSFMAQRGTPQWDKTVAVFARMADLMNQSYGNSVAREHARFGFSKFTHLLGTQKIDPDHIDRTAAYVEIANHYGVERVDEAEAAFKRGATVEQVMAAYPLAKLEPAAAPERSMQYRDIIEKNQSAGTFAERVSLQKAAADSPQLGV